MSRKSSLTSQKVLMSESLERFWVSIQRAHFIREAKKDQKSQTQNKPLQSPFPNPKEMLEG